MPFIDAREVPPDTEIARDICIIGAGPAGIAVALELINSGHSVALVESGDLYPGGEEQELAQGAIAGLPYPALDSTHLRAFGGTTWHWGGNVRPLEEMDFTVRSWIKDSGWPIDRASLDEYYDRAKSFFKLPKNAFRASHWLGNPGEKWVSWGGQVASQVFHTVGEPGLYSGETWNDTIRTASNIEVYYHATVLEILSNPESRSVNAVLVRAPDGNSIRYTAKTYILACGGIDNPRLLLLSNRNQAPGLGNANGLVGRYFQEHLTVPDFATFYPSDPKMDLRWYMGTDHSWGEAWGMLRLSDDVMRANQLPNVRFQLATITNAFNLHMDREGLKSLRHIFTNEGTSDKDFAEHVAHIIADVDYVGSAAYQRLVHHPDYPLEHIDVVHIGEQTPNRESRVYLGNEKDFYGQRKVVLDWRINETDKRGARVTANVLKNAVEKSGWGHLELNAEDVFDHRSPKPHFHHMGTTRMHNDPRHGVVDKNCRVHELDNLFVAGSSVFPTSGNVNPTFSIVALAIRLADHIKRKVMV